MMREAAPTTCANRPTVGGSKCWSDRGTTTKWHTRWWESFKVLVSLHRSPGTETSVFSIRLFTLVVFYKTKMTIEVANLDRSTLNVCATLKQVTKRRISRGTTWTNLRQKWETSPVVSPRSATKRLAKRLKTMELTMERSDTLIAAYNLERRCKLPSFLSRTCTFTRLTMEFFP